MSTRPAETDIPRANSVRTEDVRQLSISKQQAAYITELQRLAKAADERVGVAVTTILAGHGIGRATVQSIEGTPDAPVLSVIVLSDPAT
jgi:hypothetical protein